VFRVVFAIHRHESLTREQFAAHWLDRHAPLVRALPGLRGYTQCLVTGSANLGAAEADGISILDFDSEADYRAADGSPQMQAAHDDAATLVSHVETYFTEPHVVP
jgi:uncharacterized protein (TIGR02118 family)